MKRVLAFLPLAFLAVLAAVAFWRLSTADPNRQSFASPERPAPSVTASLLGGGEVKFSDIRTPTIVNVWATWCTPCKAEHPVLMQMKEQGAPIIGVLYMDQNDQSNPAVAIEKAQAMLVKDGDPFRHVAPDPVGEISLALGITGVPESFLINAQGQIVKTVRGPLLGPEGESFLKAYQAEAAKSAPGT